MDIIENSMKRWVKVMKFSLIAFLISDLSSYVNGETINIDEGGCTPKNKKIIALIPTRLNSQRLPAKPSTY